MNRHKQLSNKFTRLFKKAWGSLKGLDTKVLAAATEKELERDCKVFGTYINQQAKI